MRRGWKAHCDAATLVADPYKRRPPHRKAQVCSLPPKKNKNRNIKGVFEWHVLELETEIQTECKLYIWETNWGISWGLYLTLSVWQSGMSLELVSETERAAVLPVCASAHRTVSGRCRLTRWSISLDLSHNMQPVLLHSQLTEAALRSW